MDDKNPSVPPAARSKTRPFGDEFVRRSAIDSTRPLRGLPTQNLDQEVRAKIDVFRQELDYVRHLTSLFAPPVAVLRVGIQLSELPAEGLGPKVPERLLGQPCATCREAFDGSEAAGTCLNCGAIHHIRCWTGACSAPRTHVEGAVCGQAAFSPIEAPLSPEVQQISVGLARQGLEFAMAIANVLRSDPKAKQRSQVCVFQYEEAYRAFQEAATSVQRAESAPAHQAWEALSSIGIERVKGKAYAICGFYENFKGDEVLCELFPPPKPKASDPLAGSTRPLESPTRPLKPPSAPAPAPPAAKPDPLLDAGGGILGKIRNLFSKT